MSITIITDCRDENAFGRQLARATSLFPGETVVPLGVRSDLGIASNLEAAGNIIDILDAHEDRIGMILMNVAPRSGAAHKWENGSPFGWFNYKNVLILSTVDGLGLSLIKKLKLIESINVFDIPTVVTMMRERGVVSEALSEQIMHTQFRSFEFLPRALRWMKDGIELPTTPTAISEIPDAPAAVWFVDSFGNCKTTLLPDELDGARSQFTNAKLGTAQFFEHLKDVPDGVPSFTVGSSGVDGKRFVELVVQGKSAAEFFDLKSGDIL